MTRTRAGVAVLALLTLAACTDSSATGSDATATGSDTTVASGAPTLVSTATTPVVTSVAVATTVIPTTVIPTTTTISKIPIDRTLEEGQKGDDVAYLQQRLTDLRFDPGPIDGRFGTATTMALWAYQKLVGLTGDQVNGKVSPDQWLAMQDPFVVKPMQPDGGPNHLEVDLVKQVAILWNADGTPRLITHVSTGNNKAWCENGFCGTAVTPPGVYTFFRRVKGWRQAELGLLYNPVYFNQGIAVHGALSVPNGPASHGCVRIPMHIALYFPSLVNSGDAVYVFDGKKPPREYGSIPPPTNTKDPNYVPPETPTTLPPDPSDTAESSVPPAVTATATSSTVPTKSPSTTVAG